MKRTSAVAGILAFVFIVCSRIQGTHAWLISKDEIINEISPGSNDVGIREEFPENEITPGKILTKVVSFENTGTVPCFIRAKYYFSSLEAEESTEILFGSSLWRENGDGYFYYQKSLEPGETTEIFISGIKLDYGSTVSSDFNLDIYTETVQSEAGLTVEEAFGQLLC